MIQRDAMEKLQAQISTILSQHGQGMSEFDLLRKLQALPDSVFKRDPFADGRALFQAHFAVFHVLYTLREQWLAQGHASLRISAMEIQKLPCRGTDRQAVADWDGLRDYYLEWDNIHTPSHEIEQMLNGFWRRYLAQDRRQEALAILGLEDPVTDTQIDQQYRRLSMQTHPDRGGDTESFQALNDAYQILRPRR